MNLWTSLHPSHPDNCIIISPGVHHVIIKGFTLNGGAKNGILLGAGTHDIVIENNDISAWGDGSNYQAAVFSTYHGRAYIFHNTILQPEAASKTYTLGCDGGVLASGGKYYETISRNNIFTNYRDWHKTIQDLTDGSTNDFDYDLYMGLILAGTENHGLNSEPIYSSENGPGEFALQPGSSGFDAGVIIPNFNDDDEGAAPDIGAYEYGQNPMEFGVDAYLNDFYLSKQSVGDIKSPLPFIFIKSV